MSVVAALSFVSRSLSIGIAATAIAVGWVATVVWYFSFSQFDLTWGFAVIKFAQAALFWRQSRNEVFPLPLFLLSGLSVVLYLLTTLSGLSYWWIAFASNRLFDLMLLYIASCALFRILRLRQRKKGAPSARPQSLEIFAAA